MLLQFYWESAYLAGDLDRIQTFLKGGVSRTPEAEWFWGSGYRELHPQVCWHPNQELHQPRTQIQLPAEVFPLWKETGDGKQGL